MLSRRFAVVLSLVVLVGAVACTTSSPSATTSSCTTDSECDPNPKLNAQSKICVYDIDQGCAAHGRCVDVYLSTAASCDSGARRYACDCNGVTIDRPGHSGLCGFPAGTYGQPVQHDGPCAEDGGAG